MKNVTISDELYGNLVLMKQPGESFSDVINRLVHRGRVSVRAFYGVLKNSKLLDELEREVKRVRDESTQREF